MYKIMIGEISEGRKRSWKGGDEDVGKVLKIMMFEKDCSEIETFRSI